MNAQLFATYFLPYKEPNHYAPIQSRPSLVVFIAHLGLLGIACFMLAFFSLWRPFFEAMIVISGLNCLLIVFRLTPPPCIVTSEKLFFIPSLLGKGPWLYWHEIAHITSYRTSIKILPLDATPVLKRMNRFSRFFYRFFWRITKQEPHFSLTSFTLQTNSAFTIANILITLKDQGTKKCVTNPHLVLFDCDGTLVDSELISYEIYAEIFAQEGYVKTPEALLKEFSGLSLSDMIARVSTSLGRSLPPSTGERIQQKIVLAFREKLHEIPGIHQLLEQLESKEIPVCLASNGLPERIDAALNATHLSHFFPPKKIFDVNAAQQGKPAPDLFLFAAHAMNVAPENCLVIEDSAPGILAAHAAGMPVIALLAGSHAQTAWYQETIKRAHPTFIADKTEAVLNLLAK